MVYTTNGANAIALFGVLAETLSKKFALDDAYTHVMDHVCQLLNVEAGFLMLLDEKEAPLAIKKSYKKQEGYVHNVILRLEHGLVADCIARGETILADQVSQLNRFNPLQDGVSGLETHSMLCVPLNSQANIRGAIALLNKQEAPFTDLDQQLLASLGQILAYMVNEKDLVQELRVANADIEANRWELIRSRNTLRALFDNIPLSFYIIDQTYNLLAINISRAKQAGAAPQALVGKKCYAALFQRQEPCPACRAGETLFTGETTTRVGHIWKEDGYSEEWEINTYPVQDESGEINQVILSEEDVTEKRQLEYKLIQSEKLATVGQLVAGIAHEINNPLTAVIANVQLIQRDLPKDHDIQESMELIALAGERAANVVHNLLDLTRNEKYKFVPTDINLTIRKALDLLQHEVITNLITLNFHPGKGLPELLASPEHLEGVWINILANAFDAVDHTGKGEIMVSSSKHENQIQVMISDNGQGIPAERISRLFDPFFTTKAVGYGTGLGLTISQRVIKQHGGLIQVDSQLEKGTQFTIILPIK